MYLLKQLQNANAKCMGGVVNQLRNLNRTGVCSLQFDRCMSCNITKSHTNYGMPTIKINPLKLKTSNNVSIRHYYRNYDYHPNRLVRAYRMTRTWLTDHFVIADNRFENIYSFTFLVTVLVAFIFVSWLNLHVGGEAGDFDKNKLPPKEESKDFKT